MRQIVEAATGAIDRETVAKTVAALAIVAGAGLTIAGTVQEFQSAHHLTQESVETDKNIDEWLHGAEPGDPNKGMHAALAEEHATQSEQDHKDAKNLWKSAGAAYATGVGLATYTVATGKRKRRS